MSIGPATPPAWWREARFGMFIHWGVYAVPTHREGTLAEITIGGQRLPFDAAGTGGWGEFVRARVGEVALLADEELAVQVIPVRIPAGAVMNLQAVCLVPAGVGGIGS